MPWACHPEAYAAHQKLALPAKGEIGDPHVIKVDGRWYLYPSQDQVRPAGLQVWVSDDLVTWQDRGLVWQPTPGSWNVAPDKPLSIGADCGYWAPSVHRADDGYFYLYYAAHCRIGVARARTPLGPFTDLLDHPLIGGGYGGVGAGGTGTSADDFGELAIDPFLLDDPTEGLILYFVAYTPISNIYAVRLSDHSTVSGEKKLVLAPRVSSWESAVVEGVWVEPVGAEYHLMYSGNFVRTVDYAIGAARGATPFGPFERYSAAPILATSKAWGIYGPGHHSVVEGKLGDRLIVYHSHDNSGSDPPRSARLASLCVDSQGRLAVLPSVLEPPSP